MLQPHPTSMPQRGSGLSETAVNARKMVDTWQWLNCSTLFNDFVHEAYRPQARSSWTVNALCVSINWAVTMGIEDESLGCDTETLGSVTVLMRYLGRNET